MNYESIKKELIKQLFSEWLAEKHPYFGVTVAISAIVIFILFTVSIVIPFFHITWWWKLLVLSLGLYIVLCIVAIVLYDLYFDEFMDSGYGEGN
jgi:glucan phosphoethanolaminetransferase (alkaline phosphatase superfamily)